MYDAHHPAPLLLERKVSRLGQRLGVGLRFMLFALVVVAVILQLRHAEEPERAFVRQVAAEPGRLVTRWPELGVSAWESVVSASAKLIPESDSVLFLGVTPGTLAADIAYLQASYALYPRQVVRLPATSLSGVAASQVTSATKPFETKYVILYHISEQEKLALSANQVIKKDVFFLKYYDRAREKKSAYLDGLAAMSDEIDASNQIKRTGKIAVESVGLNPPTGNAMTGWVLGAGFQPGDRILLNSSVVPTTFGHAGVLTFQIDPRDLEGHGSFELEVLRLSAMEKSNSQTVNLR